MTLDYANQREQYGRSIGKFQAIQHQLAVLAENVAAARMAAALGCSGAGHQGSPWPLPLRAALAKSRTSEAAALATHIAHAVHGAIGVTSEFDLQLHTRRLHEWRAAFGAETHWNRVLGRSLLAQTSLSTLDFMRSALMPGFTEPNGCQQPPF
jgi:acyl-CoA dehydrogenase